MKAHTDAQNLWMLIRLGERHGVHEVQALLDETDFPGRTSRKHPLPPHILKAAHRALDAPDGLAALRTAYGQAAGPAGQVAFLNANATVRDLQRSLGIWADECGPAPVPWTELLAAHRARPLHDRLLAALGTLDACPAELLEAAESAALRLSRSSYTPRRGSRPPTVPEMLRKLPLPVRDGNGLWATKAYASGQITLADVLRDAFPARASAAFLGGVLTPPSDGVPASDDIRRTRRAVADLATAHLSGDPEGWAVVLRLIPDFEGTLPDLFATAGAVIS